MKVFTGLVAIVNPLGVIPIFVSLTYGVSRLERKRMINIVVNAVGLIDWQYSLLVNERIAIEVPGLSLRLRAWHNQAGRHSHNRGVFTFFKT